MNHHVQKTIPRLNTATSVLAEDLCLQYFLKNKVLAYLAGPLTNACCICSATPGWTYRCMEIPVLEKLVLG